MKEPLMSVNKYDRPSIIEKEDANYILLMRLLLLNPGSIQSHPNMGVGIISKWRYSDIGEIKELELEIEKQISLFLPMLNTTQVVVEENLNKDKEILVKISIDNISYVFETDGDQLKLSDL